MAYKQIKTRDLQYTMLVFNNYIYLHQYNGDNLTDRGLNLSVICSVKSFLLSKFADLVFVS